MAAILLDRDGVPDTDDRFLTGWWRRPGDDPRVVTLPNPWDDRDAVGAHHSLVARRTRELVDRLGELLNELNGVDEPGFYWQRLLAPWMLLLVALAADRRLFVKTVGAVASEAPFLVSGDARPPGRIRDGSDAMQDDEWNRAALGLLARAAGHPVEYVDSPGPVAPRTARRPPLALVSGILDFGGRLLRAGVKRLPGRRITLLGLIHLPLPKLFRLMRHVPCARYGGLAPSRIDAAAERVDPERRARLADVADGGPLGDEVALLLPIALPISVLEGYDRLVAESRRRHGRPMPVVHGNYSFHEIDNEYLARCELAGAPVAFAQHGGSYFQARWMDWVEFDGAMFMSWGPRGPGIDPVASPHLERLRDSHTGGREIVIVEDLVRPRLFVVRFASEPMGNQAFESFERWAAFVASARSSCRFMRLKRFPGNNGARPDELDRLPPPSGRGALSAADAFPRSRLAVVTYPDTPFIEALVCGVPTIGLWDPDRWEMQAEAAAIYDELAAAGVVFRDPIEAAERVDEVYERADAWWATPRIQEARRAFIDHFARRGDWLAEWIAALRKLSAGTGTS